MPGMAKVLGLSLTRTCIFSNGKFSVSNKIMCQSVIFGSLTLRNTKNVILG